MFSWKKKRGQGGGHSAKEARQAEKSAATGSAGAPDGTDAGATSKGADDGGLRRLHLRFVGQVQGVGFRWTAQHTARDLGLTGWVINVWDGSVVMELQGTNEQISEFFGEFAQQWRGPYAISYTIDEKEDIAPDSSETTFSVRY